MVKTIFFDFDGTLISKKLAIDSNFKRTNFFSKDFDKKQIEKIQRENDDHYKIVQKIISKSLFLDDSCSDEIPVIQGCFFTNFYIKTLSKNPKKYIVLDFKKLKKLKKKYDLKFVITTSLIKPTIVGCLNFLKIKDLFEDIFTTDVYLKKLKKDIVKEAYKKYKNKNIILMCGDQKEDIEIGKKLKLKTIQVNYGKKLKDLNATYQVFDEKSFIEKIEDIVK